MESYSAPDKTELIKLIGDESAAAWEKLCAEIESRYEMEKLWNSGGKKWLHEYKFRRGGKTLCAFYAKENGSGFMVIFGAGEREQLEAIRSELSPKTLQIYDEAETFHDGKWAMFPLDEALFGDYLRLLEIKRKPNKK